METSKAPCCGVARFFQLLEGPWASLIVRELLAGPRRFTELRQALQGISAHTLTSRLRQFEASGLVVRTAYAQTPLRVVYELTPLGEGLRGVFDALREWGESVPAQATTVIQPTDGVAMSMREIAAGCPLAKS
ncbi:helix-turn-helix transcriptional regulator [Xanthomonas vesicatoria]|uniref:MarR family transcriptional regulator n=1 Tax=Xanthomonas vesicatoria TaxID=56460 RepID=A0AAJ0J1P8_9XANT|nr:helix-turn-helix domain-containing protein [Xanthomonas vesicatoria]APO95316.1 transcriptional regulator [Xanthomonas vesicatoria]KHM92706.1 MarR family transcriptional regulator [Xanthomonas vesicatoria]KHM98313.1 MarR family transcriptional regulator [Xanthomonas vesicatoria]MCC8696203.1 helix-turn-helix transcriptional regulator [Xanthomonas vesicatoria]MCC8701768.1 helix-turn-helix transcriptional regulator [Xanthomonas vesicatoria]